MQLTTPATATPTTIATTIETTTSAPKSPGFETIGTIIAVFGVVAIAYPHRKNKP